MTKRIKTCCACDGAACNFSPFIQSLRRSSPSNAHNVCCSPRFALSTVSDHFRSVSSSGTQSHPSQLFVNRLSSSGECRMHPVLPWKASISWVSGFFFFLSSIYDVVVLIDGLLHCLPFPPSFFFYFLSFHPTFRPC